MLKKRRGGHVRPNPSGEPAHAARRRLPRPQWLLVAVVFLMFCCVLLTNGLVRSEIGVDARGAASDGPDGHVPPAVSAGGPVVDLTHGQPRTYAMPPKTVALTFDDGPDPEWTPAVLAVLAKHHVPGTFFVVGANVARHPEVVRRIRAGGSEIGVHTFTHPDLRRMSPVMVEREIAETQLALAGATGEMSYLVRPPYSSESSAVDDAGFDVISRLAREGYVTAFVDVDSNDWQRPGVAGIVRDSIPADGQGGVVLLHDAGGDRAQTVEALDRLIPEVQADGFTFTTVSAGTGLPVANFPAGPSDLLLGRTMLAAVVEPVTLVVPAHNEKECIAATVRSLVAGDHPVEVVVVDDGSTDGTADIVEALGLDGVRVIRRANGGKASALNPGSRPPATTSW
jgi:peptidoglycan/xylan/chitin deacetylase (PgdA/CDA1 family)